MQVSVQGIGLLAAGLQGWVAGRAIMAGLVPYCPGPAPEPEAAILPPNERRRSSQCVRWALQVAQEAIDQSGFDSREVATVFASSGGEMGVLDQLCRALATADRVISPTLFHQSVHNTAAGYWGIATTCQQSSTALSCYDDTYAAGLLEAIAYACSERQPVLLVAYDLPAPEPLDQARPLVEGFAAAVVLAPASDDASPALTVKLERKDGRSATTLVQRDLERLRAGNPAARILPILAAIATGINQTVHLDLLDDQRVVVECRACRD